MNDLVDKNKLVARKPTGKKEKAEKVKAKPIPRVWFGSMPESNGKTNWTAILHKGDITDGMTIARSEYHDRVKYEADIVRYILGELEEKPCILDYDTDRHSGYVPKKEDE